MGWAWPSAGFSLCCLCSACGLFCLRLLFVAVGADGLAVGCVVDLCLCPAVLLGLCVVDDVVGFGGLVCAAWKLELAGVAVSLEDGSGCAGGEGAAGA